MGECPAGEQGTNQAVATDGLWRYRRRMGQKLVYKPEFAAATLKTAEGDLKGYFAPALQAQPNYGELRVARTLRAIALSAAMHIGATEASTRLLPALRRHVNGSDRLEPFPLTDHVLPLPKLRDESLKTEQCRNFIKLLGGVLMEWSEIALLDPSEVVMPLAKAVHGLHKRFTRAEIQMGNYQTTQDPMQFTLKQPEDNASIILGMLLNQTILYLSESNAIAPTDIAGTALGEQRPICDIASTSRSYFQTHVWKNAQTIGVYERALLSKGERELSADASQLSFIDGNARSPLPSLAHGAWKNPHLCIAFPPYIPFSYTNLYEQVAFATYLNMGAEDDAPAVQDLVGRFSFSGIEMALTFGTLAARQTIYQHLPRVESGPLAA